MSGNSVEEKRKNTEVEIEGEISRTKENIKL